MHSDVRPVSRTLGRQVRHRRLNALSGIGCIRTITGRLAELVRQEKGLNALSGIGCIRTYQFGDELPESYPYVLMPCRALDAFGPDVETGTCTCPDFRLNALSGIGCIRTISRALRTLERRGLSLNALSGIGCIRTGEETARRGPGLRGLNALSGIGCIRTILPLPVPEGVIYLVLMPCRALDAFGRA